MKLSELKETSKNMSKGKEFEIFDGVFATVIPSGGEKHKFDLSYKIQKYMLENNIEYSKDIPDDVFDKISKETVVESVIVDIKGIQDENGKDIEWTKEFGLSIIDDEDFVIFFNRILEKASDENEFYEKHDITEDIKKK